MSDAGVAATAAVIAACAAIASAVISALTSYAASRRSGVQKIAEFRKEWIENLRTHFAEFHSTCAEISVVVKQYDNARDNNAKDRIGEEMKAKMGRLSYLHNYIVLMLNPAEQLHQQMEEKLRAMRLSLLKTTEHPQIVDQQPLDLKAFSELARKILKAEWNRLKSET